MATGDLNTLLLVAAVMLNGYFSWIATRMVWDTVRIANHSDEKTDRLLRHAELLQETQTEILRSVKK